MNVISKNNISNEGIITQAANSATYSDITNITFSYSSASYSSGTAKPSLSYSQTVNYSSGSSKTITSGASCTYSMTSVSGWSINASNGTITYTENSGTSSKSTTVTCTLKLNNKTATKTASFSQSAKYYYIELISYFFNDYEEYNPITVTCDGKTVFSGNISSSREVLTSFNVEHDKTPTLVFKTNKGTYNYSISVKMNQEVQIREGFGLSSSIIF